MPLGKSPLADPVLVNAGQRRVAASRGAATAVRVVDVAGGDTTTVSLDLAGPKAPPPPQPVARVTPPPSAAPPPRAVAAPHPGGSKLWIGITVTGVLAAGAVAMGIGAIAQKNDFDAKVAALGSTTQQIDDARGRTRTFAAVADILTGAAVVSGVVTLIVAVVSGHGHEKAESQPQALRLGVGPGGVSLGGAF